MGRKVVVTSVFETDIENIWCKIQDIETLREICKPKASFISYGNIPPVWKEGETSSIYSYWKTYNQRS